MESLTLHFGRDLGVRQLLCPLFSLALTGKLGADLMQWHGTEVEALRGALLHSYRSPKRLACSLACQKLPKVARPGLQAKEQAANQVVQRLLKRFEGAIIDTNHVQEGLDWPSGNTSGS